jgi:hypothetical protein
MKSLFVTTLKFLAVATIIFAPHVGQCFYNPSSGIWLSRDPMKDVVQGGVEGYGSETAASDSNPYGFVDSRPTSGFDVNGLFSLKMRSPYSWDCGGWFNVWDVNIQSFPFRNKIWWLQEVTASYSLTPCPGKPDRHREHWYEAWLVELSSSGAFREDGDQAPSHLLSFGTQRVVMWLPGSIHIRSALTRKSRIGAPMTLVSA